jgi:hypothetical protein
MAKIVFTNLLKLVELWFGKERKKEEIIVWGRKKIIQLYNYAIRQLGN